MRHRECITTSNCVDRRIVEVSVNIINYQYFNYFGGNTFNSNPFTITVKSALQCNVHATPYRQDVLKVVQQCRDAFAKETKRRRKAELSQELLAVLMYTALTPGRCREYTTLDFRVHEDSLPPITADAESPNCIHIAAQGDEARMVLSDYKTAAHHGSDHVILSGNSPLLGHMVQHLQAHRHILAGAQQHKRLFVVSSDESCDGSG